MARHGMRQQTGSPRQRGQLAFVWEEAGEARPEPSEGPTPKTAPERTGALTHLMEQVVAADNMRRALKRVRANKGSPGVDGMTVQQLPEHLKAEGQPRQERGGATVRAEVLGVPDSRDEESAPEYPPQEPETG